MRCNFFSRAGTMRSVFLTLVMLVCCSFDTGASAQPPHIDGNDSVKTNIQNGNSDHPNDVPATPAKTIPTDSNQRNSMTKQMQSIKNEKVNASKVLENPKEQGPEDGKDDMKLLGMEDNKNISGVSEDKGEVGIDEGGEKLTSGAEQAKVEKSGGDLGKDVQGKTNRTKDAKSDDSNNDVVTLEHKPVEDATSKKSEAKSEAKGKTGEIGGNRHYEPPFLNDKAESSHFFVYLVFTAVLVAVVYIAYHNKRKIIAFVLEGKRSRSAPRPKYTEYQKLEQHL